MKPSQFRDYISCFQRFEVNNTAVYLDTEDAGWFVPNCVGDDLLLEFIKDKTRPVSPESRLFFSSLPNTKPSDYKGRSQTLEPKCLSELWFHVTNRCNLTCTHCLFSSSPSDALELSFERIIALSDEAYRNGCRLFALTGGEPFVHRDIDRIITTLLGRPGSHVVVLTNGMNVLPFLERHRPDPAFFHLQISVDGLEQNHDSIRALGSFKKLSSNLKKLKDRHYPFTLSMCVNKANVNDMPGFIDFASNSGASNVHFMWYFIRGRGERDLAPDTNTIFENLVEASVHASRNRIPIDNLEALKTQIFAPAGTIHDGSTSGWESLAVGPDGRLYPSAALVGIPELSSNLKTGLVDSWLNSPILKSIRECSISSETSPFRFLLGGGDMDHSYIHNHTFMGDDPYQPLYEKLILWLISNETSADQNQSRPGLELQMGDILESCGAHGHIAFVHSNCLLATTQNNSLTTIKNFYSAAAGDKKKDILNPVCYDPSQLSHIPEKYRFRGYGCGSPVLDAGITQGDHVVDLGCGSGVECFIAAKITGKSGRVTGVDMLDPMLSLAAQAMADVEKNLGYSNICFKKGYLESLPVSDESVDTVISNCVMNLSVNKRKAYGEIFRILRPGGRLVISDVVCETEPHPSIRNNETLKGECIAGALTESRLIAILEWAGFTAITFIKRFPYRNVSGHDFFSLTYQAVKPRPGAVIRAMYRGPLSSITSPSNTVLLRGQVTDLDAHEAEILGDQIFILDQAGQAVNIQAENSCACYREPLKNEKAHGPEQPKHSSGCMVCGAPLIYSKENLKIPCEYCGAFFTSNSVCEKGHFVCDGCHARDALSLIRHICLNTQETDMIRLFEQIRRHPAVPVHGPEYHAMIPGIILTCYKNLGGSVDDQTIESGITRGSTIAGGFCGFMGICGAAVGVGIAFSLLLEASPVKAQERQAVQNVTQQVLKEIADLNAARCCQRDGYIALKKTAELSKDILPLDLKADSVLVCRQQSKNKECLGKSCLLFPRVKKTDSFVHAFTVVPN